MAIIAFIYLPISIASSIFGMNVQELNGEGVGIIWFIVAIFATFGTLVLCLLFFVLVRSQREAVKDAWGDWLHPSSYPYQSARPWVLRFWFIGMNRDRIHFWGTRMLETFAELKERSFSWIGLKS